VNTAARPVRVESLRTFLVATTGGIGACLSVTAVQFVWLYFESWVFRASGLWNYIMFAIPQGLAALGIAIVWISFRRGAFWGVIIGLLILLIWVAWFFLPFEIGLIPSTNYRH
jgi:hypothetical protein